MFGGFTLDVRERGVPQRRPPLNCPESERRRPLLLSENRFCVRTVSDSPENRVEYRHLRTHIEEHRCGVTPLRESASMRFRVRQHARAQSISKRA